jgi:AbrB family looped-hinge helix DNA binding protein
MKKAKKIKDCQSIVDARGRVTIPLAVRRHLGLKPGAKVEFIAAEGPRHVRLFRVGARINPFQKYAGILGTFPGGIEGINAWVRDMRDQ